MEVRNKTLYTKVEKFLNASIETLENLAKKEDLPVRQVTTYKFEEKGYTQEEGYETDFFIYIFKYSNNIEVLPEFQQCAKYLLKNPSTRKALGWKDQKGQPARDLPLKLTYFRLLYVILGEYLKKVGRLTFRKDKFNEIYIAFERFVYSQKVLYRVTAPLQGLFGDIEEVSFGNGFKIRRIEDSEKSEYLKLISEPFPTRLGNLDITEVEYTLETRYSSHVDAGIDICRKGFEDIQTVLRLLKPKRLGFEVMKTEPVSWTTSGGISYGWSHSRQGIILPNLYRLDKSDEKRLLKLWSKFKKFRKNSGSSIRRKYIDLALKWFNYGIEENDVEIKIVDFVIAFEALFLPERGELTYRLANRIAILLGKNGEDAVRIKDFMIRAYGLRSQIVHGKEIKPIVIVGENFRLNEFAEKACDLLRKSLVSFIVLSDKRKNREHIMSLLDRSLLDAKKRRSVHEVFLKIDDLIEF